MESLDEIDRRILALLQAEVRLTGAELGRRVGLSQPAASARVQRLEKTGVITGYRAIVDPAKLGLGITAHIRLRTSHAQLEQALALAARTPDITAIRRVTGEDCLLCDVHCSDARRLETIIDSLARFGPVTTALVLHDYSARPLTPVPD
ncbi:Lrp/AsnC family transcriptional regulator [Kribbella sindirgiensis]|uniref:Lrp/AsnC family transcriptional regulator n=1 Tax=Kribbella sindirgiensis TaxID=1124744 RepID=A0A4R0I6C2_9ACTN|nr:Lrp/AsnC family transcriptional regulator [Kribbella sindirgiensis]TCC24441.1 Lrp/AsnC family transcriptional regulator [Kribbella sindirgiensis]